MRTLAVVLLSLGVISGVGFLVDGMRGGRGIPHSFTARAILVSAAGILLLVVGFLVEAIWAPGPDWAHWLLSCGAGLLATGMYPVWWVRMRWLRRTPTVEKG